MFLADLVSIQTLGSEQPFSYIVLAQLFVALTALQSSTK